MAAERARSIIDVPEEERPDEESYRVAKPESIEELLEKDVDDESLQKYKEQLLGGATKDVIPHDPNDDRNVLVESVEFLIENRDPVVFKIGDENERHVVFQEGCEYQIKVSFWVQRQIVLGLKFVNVTKKLGVKIDKMTEMIGSFAPNTDMYDIVLPKDTAPSGMMARGKYSAKARFLDDDGNVLECVDYTFEIKKNV